MPPRPIHPSHSLAGRATAPAGAPCVPPRDVRLPRGGAPQTLPPSRVLRCRHTDRSRGAGAFLKTATPPVQRSSPAASWEPASSWYPAHRSSSSSLNLIIRQISFTFEGVDISTDAFLVSGGKCGGGPPLGSPPPYTLLRRLYTGAPGSS